MDRNPQADQMASDAMVQTLAAQAEALWPLEAPLFDRYGTPQRILDVGCGTGEVTLRLADRFPGAQVLGVDVHAPHLERARRAAGSRTNAQFHVDDAFELNQPTDHYDLVVCRHVVQSLPSPHLAIAELARVCKPGGWLHILAEDYGMMHFAPTELDTDHFWREGPWKFAASIDNDLRIGRKLQPILAGLGLDQIAVDYLVVDTQRVDRELFARIWQAWADGYSEPVAAHTDLSLSEIEAHWADMIRAIRTGYALWQVPIWSARA